MTCRDVRLRSGVARGVLAAVVVSLTLLWLVTFVLPTAAPLRVEIEMRYSRFTPAVVRVPAGRPITFVLRNQDPIDHEWIVGDERAHAVHRRGTEAHHGQRPTEISVPALESRTTILTFQRAGTVEFMCHLPGHEAYGMVGVVQVEDG